MPHAASDEADDEAAVLVVEDDAILALELSQTFRRHGVSVLGPYPTYRRALEAIAQSRPRRAVLDIDLGAGDLRPGFEGERLLAVLTSAGCRCVVHSGRAELFRSITSRFPGVTLIPKPTRIERVVEALLQPAR